MGLITWLPAGQPALAQAMPPAPTRRADSLAATPPDTAGALGRLFAARRERCSRVVACTLGAGLLGAAVVASIPPAPSGGGGSGYGSLVSGPLLNDQALKAFAVGVATVPVVLVELVLVGGWSRRREQRTIEAWRQHQLPRYFRRQLTARYFLPDLKAA